MGEAKAEGAHGAGRSGHGAAEGTIRPSQPRRPGGEGTSSQLPPSPRSLPARSFRRVSFTWLSWRAGLVKTNYHTISFVLAVRFPQTKTLHPLPGQLSLLQPIFPWRHQTGPITVSPTAHPPLATADGSRMEQLPHQVTDFINDSNQPLLNQAQGRGTSRNRQLSQQLENELGDTHDRPYLRWCLPLHVFESVLSGQDLQGAGTLANSSRILTLVTTAASIWEVTPAVCVFHLCAETRGT